MNNLLAARVKETTTTTGNGTLDLLGAEAGFQSFVAGIGDGKKCYYTLIEGNNWEVGIGEVTDSVPDTLSRDVVLASSNAGSKLVLSAGAKEIFCDAPAEALPLAGLGQCRLDFVSTTQITLAPFNGNQILIKDGGWWRAREIPSAGMTAANTSVYVDGVAAQNLAADTTYYVCLFDDGGTPTMDFISFATGRATDSDTGMEIKTGDATRTLVGMIRTDSSSQFSDILTLSWFNVLPKSSRAALAATRSTGSTSYVEIGGSGERADFLTWGNRDIELDATGSVFSSVDSGRTSVGIDGTTALEVMQLAQGTVGAWNPMSLFLPTSVSEGYHQLYLLGRTSSTGTSNWRGSGTAVDRTTFGVNYWG